MKYIDYTTAHGQRKLRDEIHRICKIAGLARDINGTPFYDVVHPHTGRHTFSTLLSSCRVPDDIIAITTGHSLARQRKMLAVYIHDETHEKARMLAEELQENEKMQKCFVFADPNGAKPQAKSTAATETTAILTRVEQLAIEKHELIRSIKTIQTETESGNTDILYTLKKNIGNKGKGNAKSTIEVGNPKSKLNKIKETADKALGEV